MKTSKPFKVGKWAFDSIVTIVANKCYEINTKPLGEGDASHFLLIYVNLETGEFKYYLRWGKPLGKPKGCNEIILDGSERTKWECFIMKQLGFDDKMFARFNVSFEITALVNRTTRLGMLERIMQQSMCMLPDIPDDPDFECQIMKIKHVRL